MLKTHASARPTVQHALFAGALCFGLMACADTEQSEQDFIERDCKAKGVAFDEEGCVKEFLAGSCEPPLAGEADGTYQLVISAVVNAGAPLLAIAEVTSVDGADGLELTMDLTWLAAADRKTPTSETQTITATVGGDGALASTFDIDIAADANPVIAAALVAPEVNLAGVFCKDPAAEAANCGAVTGNVTAPAELDLNGSSFTLLIADPAALPDDPIIDCTGATADPL